MANESSPSQRSHPNRRSVLSVAATTAAAGAVGAAAAAPTMAAQSTDQSTDQFDGRSHGRFPVPAGEFVFRGGHVLTMDPGLGELPEADVHVRDGKIVAVGPDLRVAAPAIDARGTIVLPGLVDTHWHMWTGLYRSLAASSPDTEYFGLNIRLGRHVWPLDLYRGVRVSLADAVHSGITTVHDWSHNLRGPAHADANLQAHAEAGLRGRFSYGTPQGHPAEETIDLADFRRVEREWFRAGKLPTMHFGLAGRAPGATPPEVYRAEYAAARELGLPVSYHAGSNREQGAQHMISRLSEEDMLGSHTQLIHVLYATSEERAAITSSGASVSISPWSELLVGYGVTPVAQMLDDGFRLSLSVDTLPLTGTAELFSVLRVTMGLAKGQAEDQFGVDAGRILELATIEGARGLGIADVTGSLTPGKRADVIMVRGDDVNIGPFTHAPNMIALAAQPANVDTVVCDGKVLKYQGKLTTLDADRIMHEAEESLRAVQSRAD